MGTSEGGMSEEIKPALTAEQWAKGPPGVFGWDDESVFVDFRDGTSGIKPGEEAAVIAAANDALPDSDPRKITRERIAGLREMLQWADDAVDMRWGPEEAPEGHATVARHRASLAALESYLP